MRSYLGHDIGQPGFVVLVLRKIPCVPDAPSSTSDSVVEEATDVFATQNIRDFRVTSPTNIGKQLEPTMALPFGCLPFSEEGVRNSTLLPSQ